MSLANEEAEGQASYRCPTVCVWSNDAAEISKQFNDFITVTGLSGRGGLIIRDGDLADIALRVDKRRDYYRYFHSIRISERKTSALVAYWVIKFHPITFEASPSEPADISTRDFYSLINEHFAAYLLIAPCLESSEKIKSLFDDVPHPYDEIRSSDYYQKLIYSLRYRNISIDAFVLLAETIVPEVFLEKFEDRI